MKVLLAIIVIFAVLINVVFFFLLWSNTPQDERQAATVIFLKTKFIESDTGRGDFAHAGIKVFGWIQDGHFYFERIYEGGEGVTYRVKIDETIEILP